MSIGSTDGHLYVYPCTVAYHGVEVVISLRNTQQHCLLHQITLI